jgi:anti-anti-sigma factor
MSQAFHIASGEVTPARREVALAGRVYADAAPALRASLDEATGRSAMLVIDAVALEHIDGVALQVFVDVLKVLRPRGGRLVFFGLSPIVARTFAITGLDRLVTIVASRAEAQSVVS